MADLGRGMAKIRSIEANEDVVRAKSIGAKAKKIKT